MGMRVAIGTRRPPKGGLGNRVLTYISLRSVASKFGARYFSYGANDRKLIRGIFHPLFRVSSGEIYLRSADFLDGSAFQQILAELEKPTSFVVKGALLGDVYARFASSWQPPGNLLRAKRCKAHEKEGPYETSCVIHFRGGDFYQWNSEAVMPLSYYMEAIDSLENPISTLFRICSDEPTHEVPVALKSALQSRGLAVSDNYCQGNLPCDFASMACADVLIASPSTLCIGAGILGSPGVIYQREWVEKRADEGELFWQSVLARVTPNYVIRELV